MLDVLSVCLLHRNGVGSNGNVFSAFSKREGERGEQGEQHTVTSLIDFSAQVQFVLENQE